MFLQKTLSFPCRLSYCKYKVVFSRTLEYIYLRKSCSNFINLSNNEAIQNRRKCSHFNNSNINSDNNNKVNGQNNYTEREFDIIDEYQSNLYLTTKFPLKNVLYGEKLDDDLLNSINDTKDVDKLLQIFDKVGSSYQVCHYVQTIILLWDFQRESSGKIQQTQTFNRFLQKLGSMVCMMTPDELTCSYLYLKKIDVDSSHPTMTDLFLKLLKHFSDTKNSVSLPTLSRFSVAVNTNKEFSTILVCQHMIPHLIKHIETCKTDNDMRLITICMQNINQLVTTDLLTLYKDKVNHMLNIGAIHSQSIKCIIKMLNFLNFPYWPQNNSMLIRKLMLLLSEEIEKLSPKQLEIVFRLFQSQLEPAIIAPKLLIAAEKILEQNPSPQILECIVQFFQPNKREKFTDSVKEMIEKEPFTSDVITTFFKTIRALKISDAKLINSYWTKSLDLINSSPNESEDFRILKHCHRYMHFNNNLGGTYRHYSYEKKICELAMNEITNGISGMVPYKFARLASFVIAYGHTTSGNRKLPQIIVDKIKSMANQFTIFDCFQLSRGLEIALEMRFRHYVPYEIVPSLLTIENVFLDCTEKHLAEEKLSIEILNTIVRSLNNIKTARKTSIYKKAINKYKHIDPENLNSRTVRDITFNLNLSIYRIPILFDHMFAYIIKNKDYVMGDTVEKVLYSAYNLNYTPDFKAVETAAEIIQRDFNFMTGISVIQSCIALCYYRAIPEKLINRVFCIEFIKQMEEEIHSCYSKATYPDRVLNLVMQLNRAICLDFPELSIPWFQQNYIEAQMSKKTIRRSNLQREVQSLLVSLIKDEKYLRCNHVTPYGYTIDFVIHFDSKNSPIPVPVETTLLDRITKVAILLLKIDSFCNNDNTELRGDVHLKMRHLEMLGYKVVYINTNDWNSMYMNVPGARLNFLKSLLQLNEDKEKSSIKQIA